jgi:hypothetical protein
MSVNLHLGISTTYWKKDNNSPQRRKERKEKINFPFYGKQ